jgi:putative nucleotidyltransferase with HDIG domain
MASRVLTVDDDDRIVKLTLRFLENSGYEARGITDPRKASDEVRSFKPDVCILDVNMPHVTGSDLLNEIKGIDPCTEVILLTGRDDTRMAVDLMKRGAADFLLKPIDPRQLDMAITRAVEHRHLVLENISYKLHLETLVEERSKALNEALYNLNTLHEATVETLASALDLRDRVTSGHSRRVADMTVEIARNLGINDGELVQIEQGALLHDIGKLRIPDSILWKPSDLTQKEWEVMRRHPEYGHDFVQRIEFLKQAADIILSHHEKFDGTGYPRGLRGKEISLGARIFAIVDSMDAMMCDRPYHRGTSFTSARREIMEKAGNHFDPDLVEPALTQITAHLKRKAEFSPEAE